MRFWPGNNDGWYQIPSRHNPDVDLFCWEHNQGEFSEGYINKFEAHLKRYSLLLKYYAKLNGKKLKSVLKQEPLFLGVSGLESLVYK